MNWDDDALVLQYYWGLNETIKDEIVRMNQPEELQNMINIFININSCQWEQQMKRTGTTHQRCEKDIISSEEVTYEPWRNWEALWAATTSEARMMHEQAL
jgi:hypothetical protein